MENTASFRSVVSAVPNPRQAAKVLYPPGEVLLLSLCGVVSGCESFVDIAEYGEEKLSFLRERSPFRPGIDGVPGNPVEHPRNGRGDRDDPARPHA